MNKRNEEYIEGEKIVLDPFLNRKAEGTYELLQRCPCRPIPPVGFSPDISGLSEWAIKVGDSKLWNGYFLRERYNFDERDYEEYNEA